MIVLEGRQVLARDIHTAHGAGARLGLACETAGIELRTLQRWKARFPVIPGALDGRCLGAVAESLHHVPASLYRGPDFFSMVRAAWADRPAHRMIQMTSLAIFSGLSGGSNSLFDQSSIACASGSFSSSQARTSAYMPALTRVAGSGTTRAVVRAGIEAS